MSKVEHKFVPMVLVVYFVVMSMYAIFRAHIMLLYQIKPTDLLIFNESLSSVLKGTGFFYNSIEKTSHFGIHNSPILFFLLPFYKFWPSIDLLVITQTLAITVGAIPIFKLAEELLKDERKAFSIMLLYLFSPFILGIIRFDFHAVSFAVPFITLTMYYLEKEDYKKAFFSSLIVLLAREDAGLFPLSLGLMMIVTTNKDSKKLRWAILYSLIGILWIALSVFVVIPHFSVFRFSSRYNGEILWKFVGFLILAMFTTTGFLPILAGKKLMLILIPFSELALSNYWAMLSIGDHYQWLLGPLLVVVSIYGAQKIQSSKKFWLSVLVGGIFSILFSPIIQTIPRYPYVIGTRIDLVFKLALKLWFVS